MPRPRQAMGRPGTAVIPAGWAKSHAGVIAKTLGSTVAIGAPGGVPTRNPVTRQMETTPAAPVYEGPASLMAVSDSARALTVVEDPTKVRVYDVTLPYAVMVGAEHVITVVADPDPGLVGKTLTVTGIERGSRRFSRVLLATLND